MNDIKTYDQMNKNIVSYLELMETPITLYAAKRIEELEQENKELVEVISETIQSKI